MVNVAVYVRLSDEDRFKQCETDDSESIQNQKSMLTEYCKERNWDIYDVYSDEDYSGADINRPAFQRMLSDCENGRIDIVLCKTQSRFSRDMEVIERYLHNKFIEWSVRFISIVDHADTSDEMNKKSRQINALMNEWYLEDTSLSVRKTLEHKRRNGEFTGAFAPYGYMIDPSNKNHLVVDENTAPIVKDIFEWYTAGWGYRKIVMELNRLGYPNPTTYKQQTNSNYVNANEEKSPAKGLWTNTTIYSMIRNETYVGNLVQSKTHNISYKNKKRKRTKKEDWIRSVNTHEAIISQEVWEATQKRLASKVRTAKVTMELSPLSGKVKCAVCGRPMKRGVYYNKDRSRMYYNLTCATYKTGAMNCENTKSLSGQVLEKYLLEQINRLISDYCDESKLVIHDDISSKTEMFNKQLEIVNSQLDSLDNKITKLYEDKLDELITKEQYLMFSTKIAKEKDKLFNQKCFITEKIDKLEKYSRDDKVFSEIAKKYTHIDKITKNIADEFIDSIFVGEVEQDKCRKITVNWAI